MSFSYYLIKPSPNNVIITATFYSPMLSFTSNTHIIAIAWHTQMSSIVPELFTDIKYVSSMKVDSINNLWLLLGGNWSPTAYQKILFKPETNWWTEILVKDIYFWNIEILHKVVGVNVIWWSAHLLVYMRQCRNIGIIGTVEYWVDTCNNFHLCTFQPSTWFVMRYELINESNIVNFVEVSYIINVQYRRDRYIDIDYCGYIVIKITKLKHIMFILWVIWNNKNNLITLSNNPCPGIFWPTAMP